MRKPEAPLFIDPVFLGAADPTVIWNHMEQEWWMIYTQRPATLPGPGVTSIHGSDLGVASSPDGHDWLYRGTLEGLEFEHGRNTFWAPEIIYHDGLYHMYVSYVKGMPINWNRGRDILHYTSENLWQWKYESKLDFGEGHRKIIDACVAKCPDGKWRLWYKNEEDNGFTYMAESDDLYNWTPKGAVVTDFSHEGPNVFEWKGAWWMIVDAWRGQAVFKSDDTITWKYSNMILENPGKRDMDNAMGNHAKVLVAGDEAYIFYFCHPKRGDADQVQRHMTAVQVARLTTDGETISCDRDEEFDFVLPSGEALGHFS